MKIFVCSKSQDPLPIIAAEDLLLKHDFEPIIQREMLRENISNLLQCESIAMLPGWRESVEAILLHGIASSIGMLIIYLQNHNGSITFPCENKEDLINTVEKSLDIPSGSIRIKTHKRTIADAIKIASKIAAEKLNMDWDEIGSIVNRDRSTAFTACKNADILLKSNKDFREKYQKVLNALK